MKTDIDQGKQDVRRKVNELGQWCSAYAVENNLPLEMVVAWARANLDEFMIERLSTRCDEVGLGFGLGFFGTDRTRN